jgi:DNA-binding CsgD family transcriptional regulator
LELLIPHLHQALVRTLRKNRSPFHENSGCPLTKRELEILQWIKEGKTGWEISVIMDISENTVRFHIKNILKKLGAVNKTHAVSRPESAAGG